jgi:segregation and condensation protein A
VNLEEKKEYVLECVRKNGTCSFREILKHQNSKAHIIVAFLAILELMKIGKIEIEQQYTFDDIIIYESTASEQKGTTMEEQDGTTE